VHTIVDASRQAKGIAIINLPASRWSPAKFDGTITLSDFDAGKFLVMATRNGIVKKSPLEQFEKVRSSGIIAITIARTTSLAWVDVATGKDDVIVATAQGKIARFPEEEVRPMGRPAAA